MNLEAVDPKIVLSSRKFCDICACDEHSSSVNDIPATFRPGVY